MSQAIVPSDYRKPQSLTVLKAMGSQVQATLSDALPAFMRGQAPAMLRALYTECQKTPSLLNCTPESLFGATIVAGQMGLMLGSALGQAYLIPFKGKATLIPGYKGYIQLVNRSGQVGVISATTVYDKDHFVVEYGTSPRIEHKPGQYDTLDAVKNRKAVAFYATCQTRQCAVFHAMTRAEAEFHRMKFAMQKNGGVWHEHFEAMSMKTCIIKLCKYLPMSAELQTAVNIDELAETDSPFDASFMFGSEASETPQIQESKTEELAKRLKETKDKSSADKPNDGKLFNDPADQKLPD